MSLPTLHKNIGDHSVVTHFNYLINIRFGLDTIVLWHNYCKCYKFAHFVDCHVFSLILFVDFTVAFNSDIGRDI